MLDFDASQGKVYVVVQLEYTVNKALAAECLIKTQIPLRLLLDSIRQS